MPRSAEQMLGAPRIKKDTGEAAISKVKKTRKLWHEKGSKMDQSR